MYLIDRGKQIANKQDRIKKVIFEKLKDGKYFIRYASLDGSLEYSFQIEKDENYNLSYFSFDGEGKRMSIAPEKNSWDLIFTMYTHIFNETPANIPQPDTIIPYLLTGVLQNRNNVTVVEDGTSNFESIKRDDVSNYLFEQTAIDVIGFDWKLVALNQSQAIYTIVSGKNYIIKDTEGFYYKLRFTDFYSNTGEKGFPTFEYQRL